MTKYPRLEPQRSSPPHLASVRRLSRRPDSACPNARAGGGGQKIARCPRPPADSDVREWSFAWRTALYARLHEGEGAHSMFQNLLSTRNTCLNFFRSAPADADGRQFRHYRGHGEMLMQIYGRARSNCCPRFPGHGRPETASRACAPAAGSRSSLSGRLANWYPPR